MSPETEVTLIGPWAVDRSMSTRRCVSSSCATSSTATRPWTLGSISMSPLVRRTSSSTGPSTSNVFCMCASSLALGVTGQALAGHVDGTGLRGPRDRAHAPRVHGDSLALGRLLDGALARLGKAQADPRRELLAGAA